MHPGQVSGQVDFASTAEVDLAVAAASEAFEDWRRVSLAKRAAVLFAARQATAGAATPAAGTTHTSERSYAAFTGSRVANSTDCSGRRSVEMGFKYPRTRISSPLETPPSMPPALLCAREKPVNPSVAV